MSHTAAGPFRHSTHTWLVATDGSVMGTQGLPETVYGERQVMGAGLVIVKPLAGAWNELLEDTATNIAPGTAPASPVPSAPSSDVPRPAASSPPASPFGAEPPGSGKPDTSGGGAIAASAVAGAAVVTAVTSTPIGQCATQLAHNAFRHRPGLVLDVVFDFEQGLPPVGDGPLAAAPADALRASRADSLHRPQAATLPSRSRADVFVEPEVLSVVPGT